MAARKRRFILLTKFRVWRTDDNNFLHHPDAYVPARLMKEILDKFLAAVGRSLKYKKVALCTVTTTQMITLGLSIAK
jgi:hypothetical protein